MLPWDVLELGLSGGCDLQTACALLGNHQQGVEQVDVGGTIDSVDVTFQTGQVMLNATMRRGG